MAQASGFEETLRLHRRAYEWVIIAILGVATLSVIGAFSVIATQRVDIFRYGAWAGAASLLLFVVAIGLAHPIDVLRSIGAKKLGGAHYERAKHWTQLKVACAFLNLMAGFAGIIVVGALLGKGGLVNVDIHLPKPVIMTGLLDLFLGLSMAVAFAVGLRTPIERESSPVRNIYLQLSMAGACILAAVAGVLGAADFTLPPFGQFHQGDAPFFILAGYVCAIAGLFISRRLPTVYALFAEEREYYGGGTYLSKKKSVVMPAVMAFALLFVVLFTLFVFQLGIVGVVQEVPRDAVLLGVFGFIALMMIVSVAVSFVLSKSEDKAILFKRKRSLEARKEIAIVASSAAVALVFFGIALSVATHTDIPLVNAPYRRWVDFFAFGLMAALGPYGFYFARKRQRVRLLEERFPDFLRDLAASRKAGLTLEASVTIAARGEYGALSPEIQKMADQLSWNIPFNEALERFAERVSTPLVQRAVSLINEASRSGGHVTDVLVAAATDAREIKNLENERRGTMSLYTIIIYIAFLVFLGVAAVLYGTFVPQVIKTTQAVLETGGASVGGVAFSTVSLDDFRTFYFLAAVVQGIGNGMVAGMMESGSALGGLRHSFAMVFTSYLAFGLLIG